jgi:hypothetical protein
LLGEGLERVESGASAAPNEEILLAEPAEVAELRSLMSRAQQGDESALPRLRTILDDHPEVWGFYGDLAAHAERAWISLASGCDLALAEALSRRAAALKSELTGPSPAPLERLLAERVVATWLQVNWTDAVTARAGELSIRQAELAVKRQNAAHRRYLTALEALATVQRLLPAVQRPGTVAGANPVSRDVEQDLRDPSRPHERRPWNESTITTRIDHADSGMDPATLSLYDEAKSEGGVGRHGKRTRRAVS